MRRFLDDYIASLSTRRQERVAHMLEDAKIGKDQLDIVAKQIKEFAEIVPLTLSEEGFETIISASGVESNFREAQLRVEELYELSNLISLLLDSHEAVLGSDVKALEDHLTALEKMATNYAFLLSDGGAYNYGFLEPFSDERMRDELSFAIPDRTGQSFASTERAIVRTTEGTLALPDELTVSHAMTASLVEGNATAHVLSDTGLENALTSTSTGWRMTVATATPITSSLPGVTTAVGAQVKLSFVLSQPAPASEIRLVPFSDMPMEVVQLHLYTSNTQLPTAVLEAPQPLDRPFTVHFPMQAVTKFEVTLNQPTYNRMANLVNSSEQNYQMLLKEITTRESERKAEAPRTQRFVGLLRQETQFGTSLPEVDFQPTWGPLRLDRIATRFSKYAWGAQEKLEGIFLSIFKKKQFAQVFYRSVSDYSESVDVTPVGSPVTILTPRLASSTTSSGFQYEYNLGLQRVAIGTHAPGFRGVFVSKPLPSPGDIGELRVKTAENNYFLPSSDRDSTQLTSVEYSVTNVSDPQSEADWVAVLPIGAIRVDGERFVPDSSGVGFFRFQADPQGTFALYKNGYEVKLDFAASFLYDANHQAITGLRLGVDTYNSDDILTVDYIPIYDNTVVNFETSGFDEAPLVAAYDNTGAGEGFGAMGGRNTVDLSHYPYVDYGQVAISTYSDTYGLTPYQPITVRLDDGTVATNLTNYKGGAQATLPTDGHYYIHSGNTLRFNTNIDGPFRVYYQYPQNSVRFRVVLRVNAKNFVSPTVDYVHIKAKTRRSDAARS